jgi:hypothetical protein
MNKQRIASSVSATLKRAGFSPIASGTSRFTEGVRVHATPFGASVEASHLDDHEAATAIESAMRVLAEAGYGVSAYGQRMVTVTK